MIRQPLETECDFHWFTWMCCHMCWLTINHSFWTEVADKCLPAVWVICYENLIFTYASPSWSGISSLRLESWATEITKQEWETNKNCCSLEALWVKLQIYVTERITVCTQRLWQLQHFTEKTNCWCSCGSPHTLLPTSKCIQFIQAQKMSGTSLCDFHCLGLGLDF